MIPPERQLAVCSKLGAVQGDIHPQHTRDHGDDNDLLSANLPASHDGRPVDFVCQPHPLACTRCTYPTHGPPASRQRCQPARFPDAVQIRRVHQHIVPVKLLTNDRLQLFKPNSSISNGSSATASFTAPSSPQKPPIQAHHGLASAPKSSLLVTDTSTSSRLPKIASS